MYSVRVCLHVQWVWCVCQSVCLSVYVRYV